MLQYLQDNIWMVMIAVTSGFMLLWSFIGNRVRGIDDVTSSAALQLINHQDALVLDVREQGEYDGGHLLNSKLIPLGSLRGRLGELERHRDQPIVVVCRSGNRSAMACALLKKQGFQKVHNLAGGVTTWQKNGLPLER